MPSLLRVVIFMVSIMLTACNSISEKDPQMDGLIPDAGMAQVRTESLKLIMRFLEEEIVPGISVVLVNADGVIWMEGFGEASSRSGDLVTVDTVFRVGSLSKPVTALGVMQLVAAKRIDLDAPLKDQLKQFSIKQHDASVLPLTPRQLLNHRSGLPSDLRKGMYTDAYFTQVTKLISNEYAAYHPNMVYSYSNLGYDLLGHLIEIRASVKFAEYMLQNLFQPIGMRNSGFKLSASMRKRVAAGHLDGRVMPLPPLRDMPALGLFTTARDMGRLLSRLLKRDVPGVPTALLEQMWVSQSADEEIPLGVSTGMGWFLEQSPSVGRQVRHGGSTLLFGAEVALIPEHDLGVAVLANSAGSNRMARELAATILRLAMATQGDKNLTRFVQTVDQENSGDSTPVGGYATDLGLLMVDPEHPRLCACIIKRILDLVRFDDGSLALSQRSIENLPESFRVLADLKFKSRQVSGMDLLVAERGGEEIILGNKVDSAPWESVWRERLGSYRTTNPDGDFSVQNLQLSEESGVLCLHYRVPHLSKDLVRLPLQPISENQAVIQGFGRGRGETVEIVDINGKQCLKFSGFVGEPQGQE